MTRRLRALLRTGLLAVAFAASAVFGPGGALGAGADDPGHPRDPAAAHSADSTNAVGQAPYRPFEPGEQNVPGATVAAAVYSPTALVAPGPYRELRRETSRSRRVGLFAHGEGFAPGQEVVRYDLEGGALLRIRSNWSLEGSYRWLDLNAERGRSDTGLGGPFLGLRLRF